MATFYKFGKLWEIPPAAARLGKSLPANTQAFETFSLISNPYFGVHHRYAIKAFMEERAPSNFFKERWAASYDPARKVTYVSWFLGTIAYFLDKLDFTTLASPPAEHPPQGSKHRYDLYVSACPDPFSTDIPHLPRNRQVRRSRTSNSFRRCFLGRKALKLPNTRSL
jgi:hypothetical protein